MPSTVIEKTSKRAASAVNAHFKQSPRTLMTRLDKLTYELFRRESDGTDHPAMVSYGQPMTDLASEVVAVARALAEAIDQQYPEA